MLILQDQVSNVGDSVIYFLLKQCKMKMDDNTR